MYIEHQESVAVTAIRVMSDLHMEFMTPLEQHRFVMSLDPAGVDVLVLAGDICTYRSMVDVMTMFCHRFEASDVVWVHGNHEYYGSDLYAVHARSREAVRQNKNLHWLENDVAVLHGTRFMGTTMWFPQDPLNQLYEHFMNDFRTIKGLHGWVYDENVRSQSFLQQETTVDSIVVTHHLPSRQSSAARFAGSDLNRFFVCDMEPMIRHKGPALWIHGHTHDSFDYMIEHTDDGSATRVVCNPRGYEPMALNPTFDANFTLTEESMNVITDTIDT